MTRVICDYTYCVHNEKDECKLEYIELSLEHPMYDFACVQFVDITEKDDYQSEYYELCRFKGKEEPSKRKARGKRIAIDEFVFYTKGDYREVRSNVTEEKSGVIVGTIGDVNSKKGLNAIRDALKEHFFTFRPVSEYMDFVEEV